MRDSTLVWLILGIIGILGLGVGEQFYLNNVSEDMLNRIDSIEEVFLSGNLENSMANLQETIDKWEKQEKLLEVMVNHEEVNKISESLVEINTKFKNFSSSDNISSNFALLKRYIINIKENSEFTINNIL